ncbi:hypothetical protein SH580_07040 [Coraliomargarita algicola]|uniref:DUF3352 domain-containing protein n=1 Tax=Coraliomargarita algicola TaxID=3092156 RepID=A0ABZ0RQE1_9BACT|nr:hypothetical protein [Coraliomargarita sp. J2-16]WPJ97464.1 hypothetical protein SH580_07040 [Coraliomargarita sp. J2-16]
MPKISDFLRLTSLVLACSATSFAERSEPLVTVDIESYESLLADAGALMAAVGQDASMAQLQLEGMLGAQIVSLIDTTQPWQVGVWMDRLDQSPVISIVLPVADFEAFQAAAQASMLAMLGAQYLDAGDRVVLFGSTPGAIVPDGLNAKIDAYCSALTLAPKETIEVGLKLDDELRTAATAAIEMSKAQMLSAFDQPGVDTTGMSPEMMQEMMESYFSFYQTMLMETERLELRMDVDDGDLSFSLDVEPVAGSGFADFVSSQNVDITDLATAVDWTSDMAMVVGMGDLPAAWQPLIDASMQSIMPLYGLEGQAAAEWTEVMQATLPFKGVYNISFQHGMTFSGFCEIMDASSAEVYDQWLEITTAAGLGEGPAMSYYSDIKIERDVRTFNGHSVDRIEMTINPEHPSMQMPEQQAVMEQFFKNGQVVYEMVLVGDRIYMATEGELESAFASPGGANPPLRIHSNTRLLGVINFASMMQMGASVAGESMPAAFDDLDARITYVIEANESLLLKGTTPLSLFEAFSAAE